MSDTAAELLKAIDARIAYHLAPVDTAINLLTGRVAALEAKPQPTPVPKPATGMRVVNGRFELDGEPFTDFSATVAGNAIVSTTREQRRDIFKRIQDAGGRMVRFLHVAVNDQSDGISEYQPTYDEAKAAFPILKECLDDLQTIEMSGWITIQHRHRLGDGWREDEMLFGPRPAGIMKGEVHDVFFWNWLAESCVSDWCEEFANEFADHPALGLLTIANEKLAVRSPGYWVGERIKPNQSAYQKAWFEKLNEYQAEFNLTDKDMDKAQTLMFQSWVGVTCYRRLYQRLRDAGVMCPIGSSPLFGDTTMAGLPEASCLDFTDIHVYPSSVKDLPDPFLPNDVRTIQSIANACRVVGKPLCIGEYAGIHEQRKERLASFYPALDAVARAGFDVSSYYAWSLGKPGNAGLYDAGDDAEFVVKFKETQEQYSRRPIGEKYLADWEVFGRKFDGKYEAPPIPGELKRQPWSGEHGGVVLPDSITW